MPDVTSVHIDRVSRAGLLILGFLVSCGGPGNWSNTPSTSTAPPPIVEERSAANARYSRYEGGAIAETWQVVVVDGRELKHGPYLKWRPDGTLEFFAEFENGKTHGRQQAYYPSGQIMEEVAYIAGKANGPVTRWWENGTVQARGEYKDGEPVGKWEHWDANGVIEKPKE